jgi:hypothetical protein
MQDYAAFTLTDLAQPDLAAQCLGDLLRARELTLLLGAGVSKAAGGLPDWAELVARCEQSVGITPAPGRSPNELLAAIDTIRRRIDPNRTNPDAMHHLVREALYTEQMRHDGQYPDDILSNRMLIAIGALVMASSRGSVADVFTLNFDDLLEWYLHLHGFTTQVVPNLPAYLPGNVDVTVYHPHGFVPLVETAFSKSSWLVLSRSQLIERLAASADSPWPTVLGSKFMTKRLLTVGTSMSDLDIDVILKRIELHSKASGPIGFVVTSGLTTDRRDELLEVGLVPVNLASHDGIPEFLLTVCRNAARPAA